MKDCDNERHVPYLTVEQVTGADIHIYNHDVVLKFKTRKKKTGGREKNKGIQKYSNASGKRLAFVANNTAVVFKTMITLTYPNKWERDGREVKRHLNMFLNSLRRKNLEYLWFLEFQKRGAPHYHILIDGYCDKDYVAQRWYEIVDSGDEKHLKAGTRVEALRSHRGGAHYATKYAMKRVQKTPPKQYSNVGRFWGHSKKVKPECKSVVTDVTVAQVLDYCADNKRAKNQLALWFAGGGVPPLSVIFGAGVGFPSGQDTS